MEIDINESVSKLEELIRNAKLTATQRKDYKQSLQGIRRMAAEWQQQKRHLKEQKNS